MVAEGRRGQASVKVCFTDCSWDPAPRPGMQELPLVVGFILWPFPFLKRCSDGTCNVLCLALCNLHVFHCGTSHGPLLKATRAWGCTGRCASISDFQPPEQRAPVTELLWARGGLGRKDLKGTRPVGVDLKASDRPLVIQKLRTGLTIYSAACCVASLVLVNTVSIGRLTMPTTCFSASQRGDIFWKQNS